MNTKKVLLTILITALLFTGCSPSRDMATGGTLPSDKMELEYATGFSVDYNDNGDSIITIGDDRYLLTDRDENDFSGVVIKKPVENIYLASSSVMDLFIKADALSSVKQTSTKESDWTIPEVAEAMDEGRLSYVGKYSAPDYEALLDEDCGLAIENTMIYHAPKTKEQLEALGIPVLVENSSYEKHVLGRIEWVKLYGLLTGHEKEAEAFFEDAKKRLDAVGQAKPTGKRVAFFYVTSSGYISTRKPGDYITELIELAGGEYAISSDMVTEDNRLSSMNMDVESFVAAARDADIIIYNSTVGGTPESLSKLIADNPFLADFKAVQSGEVWCTGANMFQMTGSLPRVAEELGTIINDPAPGALTFFKQLD